METDNLKVLAVAVLEVAYLAERLTTQDYIRAAGCLRRLCAHAAMCALTAGTHDHFAGGDTSGVTAKNFLSLSLSSAAMLVNCMPFPALRSRFATTPSALIFPSLIVSVRFYLGAHFQSE